MNAILAFIAAKPDETSAIIALEVLFQMAPSAIFAAQPGTPHSRKSQKVFRMLQP